MYFVVAFHPTGLVQKRWIRSEDQVVALLEEGFVVYRYCTDQVAIKSNPYNSKVAGAHIIVWQDVKETKDKEIA